MRIKVMLSVLSLLLVAGAVWAAHPETGRGYETTLRWQVEEVQKLAHRVENRARAAHRSAERYAHHEDYPETRALARLHELENRAGHFHRQLERYGQNFKHTEKDFRELRRAYTRAMYAVHDLHAFNKMDRQFDRLSDAMCELEMYAGDLFYGARRSARRYRDGHSRDWDDDSDSNRYHRHVRIVLPRVRVFWDWLDD